MSEENMSEENSSELVVESSDSTPPSKKPSKMRDLATLISAVTAMIVAIGSYFRPQDHTVTQKSYETCVDGIAKIQDAEQKNHDDIANLRGFVEGYTHGHVPFAEPSFEGKSSSSSPTTSPTTSPSTSTMKTVDVLLDANEPPAQHPKPAPWNPPPFSAIVK
jgi:hypothetical protein